MDDLPTFRFFPDPIREKAFEPGRVVCGCCGKQREWSTTRMYSAAQDEEPICPWCVADGSAVAKWGGWFNNVDPAIGAEAEEIRSRTPRFETWQDFEWLTCCGRPCIYVGEADAEGYAERFAAVAAELLASDEFEWSEPGRKEYLLTAERGDSPAVYVFQCQVCSRLRWRLDSC